MAWALRGILGFARGAEWVQIAAWWGFLPVFGAFCLLRWLLLPALLMSCMGLALGVQLWRASEPGSLLARGPARALGGLALFVHTIVGGSALVLMLMPWDEGWTAVPGSGDWQDPVVLGRAGGGVVITTGGRDKGSYWREAGGAEYEARGLPGHMGWYLAEDRVRGAVWLAPTLGDVVTFHDLASRRWLEIKAPFEMSGARGIAVSEGRVIVAGSGGLAWTDDAHEGWVFAERGHFTGLAMDPGERRILALGTRFVGSTDGGASWAEVPRPAEASLGAAAAIGADGQVYVVDGGIVTGGSLWTGPFGGPWEAREAPGGDLREVAVDPGRSEHVVVGSWGEGVFESTDGGRSWAALGPRGVSVRALAVDFAGGEVHVASGNLVARRGVYVGRLGAREGVAGARAR